MKRLGIDVNVINKPPLDDGFIPIGKFFDAYSKGAKIPVSIAIKGGDRISVLKVAIYGTPDMKDVDSYYLDRLVKTALWVKGGSTLFVDNALAADYLKTALKKLKFDADFMADVFEQPFEIVFTDKIPPEREIAKDVGGHLDGCRIGFDAGGSDRKVSAVIDGKTVYSEEVVWFPKNHSDPTYHYDGIVSALKSAASHMPRVDAVGVSSAGIFIDDRTMKASLFLKVPPELFESKVKDIYIRAIKDTFGDVPYSVINDGDVSALAGAISIGEGSVLGIAMGTSEAGGFVDGNGRIKGWLNELAFVPVDVSPAAMRDEWSGDIGCGVKYFSQDAVIKLASAAGIPLSGDSPAEKLKYVQRLMDEEDERAAKIYESIGVYLGHTLSFYYGIYKCKHVLLLGRVMSGKGGDMILDVAKKVLKSEYPEIGCEPVLPDEKFRRVGQSMAAASLPVK